MLREEFTEIPARIAAEEQAIGRAAVAGEEIPTPTDWGTVKIVARAKHAEIARQVEAAAAAYHDAVKRALPTWRERLVAEVEATREAAREAFAGVPAAVGRFQDAVWAARAVDSALHPGDELATGPLSAEAREIMAKGLNAAACSATCPLTTLWCLALICSVRIRSGHSATSVKALLSPPAE